MQFACNKIYNLAYMGHYIANKWNSKLLSEVYLIFEPLLKNFRIEFGLESPLK
jgi:hypothetical protein